MLRSVLVLASLVAAASAQCSTLSVTGSGAPGTTLQVALDGNSPNAIAWLVLGETQGTTAINLGPLGTLTLGLAAPFTPAPMGMTNLQGDASLTINVPTTLPTTGLDLFAQGVTLGFTFTPGPNPFGFNWCASNVVGFHIGN